MELDNSGTFVRRLNRRARNVEENVNKLRKAAADEALIEVVLATPADTGKARSNWQVGIGSPPQSELDPYSPGKKLGLGETGNANAAINAGRPVIASSKPDDLLYLVNNAPYIGQLNDGWSSQAPANFIERALDRARKRVQRADKSLLD